MQPCKANPALFAPFQAVHLGRRVEFEALSKLVREPYRYATARTTVAIGEYARCASQIISVLVANADLKEQGLAGGESGQCLSRKGRQHRPAVGTALDRSLDFLIGEEGRSRIRLRSPFSVSTKAVGVRTSGGAGERKEKTDVQNVARRHARVRHLDPEGNRVLAASQPRNVAPGWHRPVRGT